MSGPYALDIHLHLLHNIHAVSEREYDTFPVQRAAGVLCHVR